MSNIANIYSIYHNVLIEEVKKFTIHWGFSFRSPVNLGLIIPTNNQDLSIVKSRQNPEIETTLKQLSEQRCLEKIVVNELVALA